MQTERTDSSAFDAAAAGYDAGFTETPVGKLQRAQVWKHLSRSLHRVETHDILELNCGTGEDAMMLARAGYNVLATDISQPMIDLARRKAMHADLRQQPAFIRCAFSEIAATLPDKKFDMVFSNFGGLNCMSPAGLEILCKDIYALLKPGGQCILVIMGTKCCWERFYFMLKGRRKEAFRRLQHKSVMAATGDEFTETWYHAPGLMKRIFKMNFRLLFTRPIGLFVPPSYLNPFFQRHNILLGMLGIFDKLLGGIALFSNLADHYIIAFRKEQIISKDSAKQ